MKKPTKAPAKPPETGASKSHAQEYLEHHGYAVTTVEEMMASDRVPAAFKRRAAELPPAVFAIYDTGAGEDEALDAELLTGNDRDALVDGAVSSLAETGLIGEDAVPA